MKTQFRNLNQRIRIRKRTERYIKELYNNLKLKLLNTIAPIVNSFWYKPVRTYLVDFVFTGAVCWYVVWALFYQSGALFKGFGIAAILAVMQYYYSRRK